MSYPPWPDWTEAEWREHVKKDLSGTSEGAIKGWENRQRADKEPDETDDPNWGADESHPAFAEYEEAWAGGVADLGNADAAVWIQGHPQYEAYQAKLHKELEAKHGTAIKVYRAATDDAYDSMKSGESLGPMAVTTNPELAKNWAKFAKNQGKDFKVLETTISPKVAVMRGKAEESEIVIDGDLVSFDEWKQIGRTKAGKFAPEDE